MAQGNGGSQIDDPMLKALHEVVAEVHVVATELKGTNARLDRVENVLTTRLDRVENVLLETRQEQRETNVRLGRVEGRLESMDGRLGKVESGLADLRGEVHEGFAELGHKIDSAADRDRHLETSVQELGERVARLEARNPEPR